MAGQVANAEQCELLYYRRRGGDFICEAGFEKAKRWAKSEGVVSLGWVGLFACIEGLR